MTTPEIPGLDIPRLTQWLAETLPDIGAFRDARLLAGGKSNLTYLLECAESDVVLRRPPLGHVLPTAHDMSREFRVLTALVSEPDVPVPRTRAICTDADVNGAPFYVMDYVSGRVLRTKEDAADIAPDGMRALGERLVSVLAAIHLLDVEHAGLAGFGRPDGYMTRQLRRWGQQWDASHDIVAKLGGPPRPSYPALVERLSERLPASGRATLVHGDYRLDNALVRTEPEPEIAAVVDWEMSTLGDPLADLGLSLVYWADPGDDEDTLLPEVSPTATLAPGMPDSREVAARYAELTGFDLADLDYYVAFGCFKLAVVLEGIHARYLAGQTVGEGFEEVGTSVPRLIDRAHAILDARSPWPDARS